MRLVGGRRHVRRHRAGQRLLRPAVEGPPDRRLTSLSFYASDGTPWDDSVSREHPERLEVVLLPPDAQAASGGVAGGGQKSGSEGPGVADASAGPGLETIATAGR